MFVFADKKLSNRPGGEGACANIVVEQIYSQAKGYGAEGRTRTGTAVKPLPPQGSVSTNSTTSALQRATCLA